MIFSTSERQIGSRVATRNHKGTMAVEWDNLPPEILESISKGLTIYADYVRFRAVCCSWRASVPKNPSHLPSQLPWLMLPQSESHSLNRIHQSDRAFFDLSNNKTHLLNLPESSNRVRHCGSSHGWLVLLNETPEILLLNPLTRATLSLPRLYTFPNVLSFNSSIIGREYVLRNPDAGLCTRSVRQMRNSFIRKVVLSSSPSQGNEFTALAIVADSNLAFCKKGDDSWSFIDLAHYYWEDVVHYNGLFYAVSNLGAIAVCDFEGPFPPRVSIIQTKTRLSGDVLYTVFSGKEMLLVTRHLQLEYVDLVDGLEVVYRTVGFGVFKMNWSAMEWQKIETLGDQALFIGGNSSISFSASDFLGCLGNCIYYTDDYSEYNHDEAYGKDDLGIYRMWDRSIEPLPCYPQDSYYRVGWPLPIWVSPNPC